MISVRMSSYSSLARQQPHFMVLGLHDLESIKSHFITYSSRPGVNKKVMGYPTPEDPQKVAETAAMTSKVTDQSCFPMVLG